MSFIEKLLRLLGALAVSLLWHLFCHFVGWLPSGEITNALLVGLSLWGTFFLLGAVQEAVEIDLGFWLFLLTCGWILWIILKVWGIDQSFAWYWLYGLALPHFIMGQVAKSIIVTKTKASF